MSERTNEYRVSVALATYNGSKYLAALLESLSKQTLQPVEIVAFDDCSSDGTVAILKKYSNVLPIRLFVNERSMGVVENFKRAATACQGDYVALCDQDDVWLPDKLALSVAAMIKIDGDRPAMVFTDLIIVDENLTSIAKSYWHHRRLQPAKETFASLIYGNFVTGCTMVVNRAMIRELAKMPANVLMHDFWLACVAYGIGRYTMLEQQTLLYRQHTSNVTINDSVTWRTRWKRLTDLLTDETQAAQFLLSEIGQVKAFTGIYKDQLSASQLAATKRLIKLEREKPLVRKWYTFLIKFLHVGYQ
jgi:glycosyltransferase involved in cell wall biosynthesis